MEVKDLKQLIKMITETDITEFEMDNAEEKIVIKRGQRTEIVQMAAPAYMQAPAAMTAPVAAAQASAPATAPVAEPAGETINSPIVGTFYRAASPESAPFAEVGQVVEKGQVICLVEAMKLFNEIEAEYKCKIVKICVENAQPVEFGQPLFVIEKI
ncbi:MAG: acetyl-CoA carboxylase biotin carboxyl carrier protein [Trichlorobacter sp.]|uniref:acetyl-CoA carboxylase biotin carboxyl carrier protein n=1 Tax=Trichlorobacter sp. TaxID=2911007 RepID=UPI0025651F5D|nr:acetyl-CoA carboxylase biotin carboxyl carrier protein [Trichlorobacter sp.]MDK9719172.1 acetyl-CoA carboxylase biotin carboxyl carrier protein [Trichlorobacter sp.]